MGRIRKITNTSRILWILYRQLAGTSSTIASTHATIRARSSTSTINAEASTSALETFYNCFPNVSRPLSKIQISKRLSGVSLYANNRPYFAFCCTTSHVRRLASFSSSCGSSRGGTVETCRMHRCLCLSCWPRFRFFGAFILQI
jgi:hypothetical protein